jgi:D-alanyl-D-alanine carboxypeptidase (penicillin-binding protein 5/6)
MRTLVLSHPRRRVPKLTWAPAFAGVTTVLLALAGSVIAAAAPLYPTAPAIAARAYALVDAQSGRTLAAAGEQEPMDPASLTKLMTAYVVFEAIREGQLTLEKSVTASVAAVGAPGSRMFLSPGQSVTISQLLQGMIVAGANDAAIALAEAVALSEAAFVERMNKRAQRMGLTQTRFVNCTGDPVSGHQASARDMATVALALVRDFPQHYALFAQREFTWNGMKQINRNRLIWIDATVDGLQPAFTEATGYGLAASAHRGERRLVSVVLGAQTDTLRISETQKLLNFGFQSWETRRLYKRGERVAQADVYKGTSATVSLGFDRDVWLSLPRERFAGLKATLETRQPFVAPLAAGEKAGIMKLTREGVAVAEFPVVALEEVPVAGFLSRGWDTLKLIFLSP